MIQSYDVCVDKLVRDGIPEVMRQAGVDACFEPAEGGELIRYLKLKLIEEAEEVAAAGSRAEELAELADVVEVVDALILRLGYTRPEIEAARRDKRAKVGAFTRGVILRRGGGDR